MSKSCDGGQKLKFHDDRDEVFSGFFSPKIPHEISSLKASARGTRSWQDMVLEIKIKPQVA
jgi:hypothetical protein